MTHPADEKNGQVFGKTTHIITKITSMKVEKRARVGEHTGGKA